MARWQDMYFACRKSPGTLWLASAGHFLCLTPRDWLPARTDITELADHLSIRLPLHGGVSGLPMAK